MGDIRLEGGGTIPMYDDTYSLVPTFPRSEEGITEQTLNDEAVEGNGDSALETQQHALALSGLLFLGEAIYVTGTPIGPRWTVPVPPPIRAVDVQKVLIREEIKRLQDGIHTAHIQHYLCFG
jgi:hypothetical protein